MQTMMVNIASDQARSAQATAGQAALLGKAKGADKDALREAAVDFEAVFISQLLSPMFETVGTDELMGGGQAEGIFRSMMVDSVSKEVARNGGIGLADNIYAELLKFQEA
ncbi:hypothetical protein GCM10017044_25880 [Kordiimonas sediminis]|uniref:Flagellar protein FlgJ N-terminal domain-containing protein n=1 Tax=Kordiimonas sediminis TaxID=1735581 RepID=A0A919AX93_9PROT|nr:rod-binding protein [Kordiimonas sediminis]GHF29441.1 hypothetical protein GCM10017044_25880 [Kordiimonas sediminis]